MYETWRSALEDRLTPAMAWTRLQALAQAFNWIPSLRRHLRDRHPLGPAFAFESGIQYVTRDGGVEAYIRFADGRARAGLGRLEAPDVTISLRTMEHLRRFLSAPAELFNMLLENDVVIEGNLSHAAKLSHMATSVLRLGQARPRANGKASKLFSGPARWQDMQVPPAGEPCAHIPEDEVEYLDDPHLAGYTLDDFPRAKRLLWAFRTTMPELDAERARLLTEFRMTNDWDGLTPALRQARALAYIMRNKRAIIHEDDLLAGTTTAKRIGVIIYPEGVGVTIWPELLTCETRELNPYRIDDADLEQLDRFVFPYWMDDNVREWTRRTFRRPEELRLEERWVLYFLWKHTALSHTIADLPRVLAEGLEPTWQRSLARVAEESDPVKRDFYRAMAEAVSGVMDYSARMAAQARSQAAGLDPTDPRRAELMEMARVCDKVPAGPAESLHEACQAVWIVFLAMHQESTNAGLSIGRLDLWLQPYFEKDLAGVSDPGERLRIVERAIELTCALMLKFTDALPLVPDIGNKLFGGSSSNPVITLGGQTSDGGNAVCDMTWIYLKATEMLRLKDPNVNARYAPGVNSEAYLRRLCEVNLLTRATPSLHSDDAVVPALQEQGFSIEDARDWSATGCVEPTSCGRHFGHTNCMMFNLVAPLEMALRDGFHPLVEEQLGPHSGDPRAFTTYEQFLDAYHQQLDLLLDRAMTGNNQMGKAHQQLRPTPFLSALFDGPMDAGKDVTQGGAKYNTSGIALIGLSDVIDSLATIKRLVFDAKTLDMDELLAALDSDFDGHEQLLATIQHKVPKFGQQDALTDGIARDLMEHCYQTLQAHDHYRGGRYLAGYWSMSNHVAFGKLSGALPSGRPRGKAFTPGLTPAPGCGGALTDQIRCVAGLPATRMPNNIAFNVKVVPGAGDSHSDVLDRMTAYVGAYFDQGGMQMQFNVVSTETLRDAQAHPEKYRDLLVRISGYNAYFVELNEDMQVEVIERMEHDLSNGSCR